MKQLVTSEKVPESTYLFRPGKKQRGLSQESLPDTPSTLYLDFKLQNVYEICCLQITQPVTEPAKPKA